VHYKVILTLSLNNYINHTEFCLLSEFLRILEQ